MAEAEVNNDVPSNYDAFEIKELMIESAMRSHVSGTMTTYLKDEDLQRAISFEPKDLEAIDNGAPGYVGVDLYTALQIQAYDLARLDFLNNVGLDLSQNPKLQEKIKEMLDVELNQLLQGNHRESASLQQKFISVACARVKAAMLAPDPRDLFEQRREKFDFVVSLTTLRGGYPGNEQRQRLFFTFPENDYESKSFIDFLAQLQEATQLSVIPPVERLDELHHTSYRLTRRPLEDYDGVIESSTPFNALGIMLPTPPDSFTTTSSPLRPVRDVKGYTLNDGPWVYTSKLNSNVLEGKYGFEKKKNLFDKRLYDNMILLLKGQTTSVLKHGRREIQAPKPGTLVVDMIHSMDLAALERHFIEVTAHAKSEEEQFRYSQRVAGVSHEDIGVPFGAYLKREIADEKEKASRGHYHNKHREMMGQKVRVMTENVRKQFFERYSAEFAQKPFEAEVQSRKRKFIEQLDVAMKRVPRDSSGL